MVGKGLVRVAVAAAAVCAVEHVAAVPRDNDKVPNGNMYGSALGHTQPLNDDDLNAFGEDYENAGRTWTTALCQADSDNDGRTNGEELGDPDCVWTRGGTPSRTDNLSDPSVPDEPGSYIPAAPTNPPAVPDNGDGEETPVSQPPPPPPADSTGVASPATGTTDDTASYSTSGRVLAGAGFALAFVGSAMMIQRARRNNTSVTELPVAAVSPRR
eukprot:CAMPEP_0171458840 /NCGR_PEP_ID=MMETSP0945-20130129/4361_1 /TAXON_ID=109269 /ORGANISM="Vaucheria litorea, Strain CCMP2940" /LENGTH=213 /DNA_ID=CAMNT_0011984735 /DNA_START=78 /DNA_END=719 /DNA_ORIENTATION=+